MCREHFKKYKPSIIVFGVIAIILAIMYYAVLPSLLDDYMIGKYPKYMIADIPYTQDGEIIILSGTMTASSMIEDETGRMAIHFGDKLINCIPASGNNITVAGYFTHDQPVISEELQVRSFQVRRVLSGC